MQVKEIETFISKIPDYPKPGILFYDISTLLSNGKAFKSAINHLETLCSKYEFDLVAGIDARGFIFGSTLSCLLNKGFIMIRKENKLPGRKISYEYELEYGKDTLEVNIDLDTKKVLLVDDLLATGGTAHASSELIRKSGGSVSCFLSLIELDFLKGRKKLEIPVESLIHY